MKGMEHLSHKERLRVGPVWPEETGEANLSVST